MKRCDTCGVVKASSEFHKRSAAPDGLQYDCKDCQRDKTRARQQANATRHRQRVAASSRKRAERDGHWAQEPDRARRLARKQLAYAVERGHIARPDRCDRCGKPCRPHGHHSDYSKPLEVAWLCPRCHRAAHNPYTPTTIDP